MRHPLMSSALTPRSRLTRRTLAGAAASVAAGLALRGTMAQSGSPVASPTSGQWSFTDDAGKTVTLPARPARIVADLNIASALWDFGIRPVAVTGYTVTSDAAWGNVDRDTPVINASAGSGDPDLEHLIALQPDLFVTMVWSPDDPEEGYSWSFAEPGLLERAERIMPVIGISGTGSAAANMERVAELAASLGADLTSPDLVAAKEAYDAAVAAFTDLAAEKADLIAAFVYIGADEFYFANWPRWADLNWFLELGLNIATPDVPATEYWEQLSLEQAAKYPADMIFQSTREEILSLDELAAHPTFGTLPAIAAGQLAPWNQDFIMSYQGLTAALNDVSNLLAVAEQVSTS